MSRWSKLGGPYIHTATFTKLTSPGTDLNPKVNVQIGRKKEMPLLSSTTPLGFNHIKKLSTPLWKSLSQSSPTTDTSTECSTLCSKSSSEISTSKIVKAPFTLILITSNNYTIRTSSAIPEKGDKRITKTFVHKNTSCINEKGELKLTNYYKHLTWNALFLVWVNLKNYQN